MADIIKCGIQLLRNELCWRGSVNITTPLVAAEHVSTLYRPRHKVRFITATSLFDGHDAAINVMRRLLQATGVEVIHLGHNRSVDEIVTAAIQEDVNGIAVSSYQGGHIEFFKYMIDLLREAGADEIKVFGGGGGVIVPKEMAELHEYGVTRLYSPEDGQTMGLQGMINDVVSRSDFDVGRRVPDNPTALTARDRRVLARVITALENDTCPAQVRAIVSAAARNAVPVLGVTGTGGSGKSSLVDELIRRFRLDYEDKLQIAVLAVDPSRRRSGGALLGDRIRMNAINHPNIYMRSLATRGAGTELSHALPGAVAACKAAGFDLIIVETSGIGQGDAAITALADVSVYVMTPEFGAASQLEKINMLDFADFVAINKFERRGAEDALHDVRKQYQRNHSLFNQEADEMPVYGTIAARFNDDGVTALYQAIVARLGEFAFRAGRFLPRIEVKQASAAGAIVPLERSRYLAEIADCVRSYHHRAVEQCEVARDRQALRRAAAIFAECSRDVGDFDKQIAAKDELLTLENKQLLAAWPATVKSYQGVQFVTKVRGQEQQTEPHLHHHVRHQGQEGRPALLARRRRHPSLAASGERSRGLPVHGWRICIQAGG